MTLEAHQAKLLSERVENTFHGPYYAKAFPVSLLITGPTFDRLSESPLYKWKNNINLRVVGRTIHGRHGSILTNDVILCFETHLNAVLWKLRWL